MEGRFLRHSVPLKWRERSDRKLRLNTIPYTTSEEPKSRNRESGPKKIGQKNGFQMKTSTATKKPLESQQSNNLGVC
jgi:hypothetical protein